MLDEALEKYPQMSAFNELMGKYLVHQASEERKADRNAEGTFDKARYYLIRAICIDEKNVNARYLMLQVETETAHYSSAIVYCNDLLEENPYNEDLWRKKIDLYRQLGDNNEADRLLERLAAIYPGDDQLRKDLVERKTLQAKHQRDTGNLQSQEESLRQLIGLEPNVAEHYVALSNLLYRMGRVGEAAEMAGQGAAVTGSVELVQKKTSMLCEMNRHREAIDYVRTTMKTNRSPVLAKLLRQLEEDAARAAQYNDAYIAYAKLYDSQHTFEALDYLINTSMERWYLDDALMYIEESLKRRGESEKMLYNQYLVHKRLGNTRRANALLEKLYEKYPDNEDINEDMMLHLLDNSKELMDQQLYGEAIPELEQVYRNGVYPYIKDAALLRLFNCYTQTRQYAKAEALLKGMEPTKRLMHSATLYAQWGKHDKALDLLAKAYHDAQDADSRALIAGSYEEMAIPYLKALLANKRTAEANKLLDEALAICPHSNDLLHYAITAAQRSGDMDRLAKFIVQGREQFPADPYFVLKDAQMRHSSGNHREALDEIKPLLAEHAGDTLLMALFAETSIDVATQLLRQKQPDAALEVIQYALDVCPEHTELYLAQSQAYEQKKEWALAYESYKKYKPGFDELSTYRHHLEEINYYQRKNHLSFEYQQARPGSESVISGNAYLNYARTLNKKNSFYVGLAYAGRDGSATKNDKEMTRGGTGIQVSGGWEHTFNHRWAAMAELGVASRYFPTLMARLSGTYNLPREWQLSAFLSYRMLRSYAGVYGWEQPTIGYTSDGKPILGTKEYVRTGWTETNRSMFQLGLGASKTIDKFLLSAGVSGFLFSDKFYFNSDLKMQFFPKEGNSSHFFAVGGLGTAPESSLIDRSMPVGFNKLNTFVGMGGSYFLNRWLTLGLSGAWYTMLSQSERLATSFIANDPYIREDYRNYFYIHASVTVSF